MSRRNAEILLVAVILARSTSFVLNKYTLGGMGPFNLLAVRFLLASLLLLPMLWKRRGNLTRSAGVKGVLLGLALFAMLTAELIALQTTSSSLTSFLENTAIVLVPLVSALLLRRWPGTAELFSAVVAMAGVGLLTLGSGLQLSGGVAWCLLAAAFYTGLILLTDRFSHQEDSLLLGIIQVMSLGVAALGASWLFETPRLPGSGTEWGAILVLAVVCTGFGFTLQPVAQSHTTAERAGLFCALSPAFSGALGYLLLGERFGVQGFLGAALILGSIFLTQILENRTAKKE